MWNAFNNSWNAFRTKPYSITKPKPAKLRKVANSSHVANKRFLPSMLSYSAYNVAETTRTIGVSKEWERKWELYQMVSDLARPNNIDFRWRLRPSAAALSRLASDTKLSKNRYSQNWSGLTPFDRATRVELNDIIESVERSNVCE